MNVSPKWRGRILAAAAGISLAVMPAYGLGGGAGGVGSSGVGTPGDDGSEGL